MIVEKKRQYFASGDYIFASGGCIFRHRRRGVREFAVFAGLSAIMLVSALIARHYYLTDKSSLKQRIISICISFVKLSVFAVVVEELTGFSLDYSMLVIFFTSREGYLHFRFCRDWEVDEEVLDEIYARFRDKAAKHSIPDLPVAFEWAD